MKSRLLFISFIPLLLSGSLFADVLSVNSFSGLNTDDSPLTLTEGQTPDSLNIITDDGPGFSIRNGYVQASTEQSSGLWEFPYSDGTRYLITNSNGELKASTGDGVFSVYIGTVPTDRTVAASPLGDRFYYADTLNGLKYWDTSSVVLASASLTVDILVTFKGRLAAAGKSGDERVIFLSKFLDGTQWTTPANPADDDATQITISGALDENIQGLYGSFQDKLIWFTNSSFGGIYGSRRSNFINRTFSDLIGLSGIETIQDCDGRLRWLGAGREVWEFDGANYRKISEDIDSLLDDIVQGDSSSRSRTRTSQSDWESGTQDPLGFAYTSINVGDLQSGATTLAYTSSADFGKLSFDPIIYADTITTSGSLQTTFPEEFTTFRTGSGGTKPVWISASDGGPGEWSLSGGEIVVINADAGSEASITTTEVLPSIIQGTSIYFKVSNIDDPFTIYIITHTTFVEARNLNAEYFKLSLSETASADLNDSITPNGCSGLSVAQSGEYGPNTTDVEGYIYISTSSFQVMLGTTVTTSRVGGTCQDVSPRLAFVAGNVNTPSIDRIGINPQRLIINTGSLDTAISTPTWDTFDAISSGSGTVTFTSQASDDGVSFDSAVALTSGSDVASDEKRYLKVLGFMSNLTATNTVTSVEEFTFNAYSSGTWTSDVIEIGSNISEWAGISINSTKTDGSQITYQFNAHSTSDINDFDASSWTFITNGEIPTNGVNTYAALRASFTVTESTHIATLKEFTINWIEGSSLKAASGYISQRYWLGVSLSSTVNNTVVVYDKSNQWQKYTGTGLIPAFMTRYNSRLYFGNSDGIFITESGTTDDGSDITGYYKTPILFPSGIDYYSRFNYLMTTTDNSPATLTTSFQIDGIDTDYSFGSVDMDETGGIQNIKMPFSSEEVQQGKFISLKWSATGTDFWRILNGNLYFDRDVIPY